MDPLDFKIVAQEAPPGTSKFDRTKWGVFSPPLCKKQRKAFEFGREILWLLLEHEGQTLRSAYYSTTDPSSYTYEKRPRYFLHIVNRLHAMGAIDVRGDRIILRRELPSPLELLARCAVG